MNPRFRKCHPLLPGSGSKGSSTVGILPSLFTSGQVLARFLWPLKLSPFGLIPTNIDFPPGIAVPNFLVLQQTQTFANHFVC